MIRKRSKKHWNLQVVCNEKAIKISKTKKGALKVNPMHLESIILKYLS